jgi:hypothetical protein
VSFHSSYQSFKFKKSDKREREKEGRELGHKHFLSLFSMFRQMKNERKWCYCEHHNTHDFFPTPSVCVCVCMRERERERDPKMATGRGVPISLSRYSEISSGKNVIFNFNDIFLKIKLKFGPQKKKKKRVVDDGTNFKKK